MLNRDEIIMLIRSKIQQAGSQRKLAKMWHVTPAYITDLLHGTRDPGKKILDAIGFDRVILYRERDDNANTHSG